MVPVTTVPKPSLENTPVHRQTEGDLLVADGHPAHPLLKLLFQFRDALTGISGHRQDRLCPLKMSP